MNFIEIQSFFHMLDQTVYWLTSVVVGGVLRFFNTFQVILGAFSKPIHTVPGQDSWGVYKYLVHILSSVTVNYPS